MHSQNTLAKGIKEGEDKNKEMTTFWVDVIIKTQKKIDEVEKWIKVTKKCTSKELIPTLTKSMGDT